jgi:hypothetical protein
MGFLSKLFSQEEKVAAKLRALYEQQFRAMGMSPVQARDAADATLNRAQQRSQSQGTHALPSPYGDHLLATYASDRSARDLVDKLRLEGVRDDDIRWWWNMHDLERCMMVENDETSRMVMFSKAIEDGKSSEEAAVHVRRHFPTFGSVSEADDSEDRALPFEIKDRINSYLQSATNQRHMRTHALLASSMNAYLRERIRTGAL